MTLTEFVGARLDEDEAAAKAATPSPWLHMHLGSEGCQVIRRQTSREGRPWRLRFTSSDWSVDHANAEHVTRHDPARVLREVEAGRALLRRHEEDRHVPGQCSNCFDAFGQHLAWPCPTIRIIAAVYSDNPDYDEAWRP